MVTPSSAVPSSETVGVEPTSLRKGVRWISVVDGPLDLLVLGLVANSITHSNLSINVLEATNRARRTGWVSLLASFKNEERTHLVPECSRFQEPLDLDEGN